jgi:hypothetical protein
MSNTISIQLQASNALELEAKKEALEKLAKLDPGTLEKLKQVASSEKAVNKFNSKWLFIKQMFL